tara:strand:+ start:1780 stop:2454 length:675 start_codon:yes stop_codon:yes gene_type:complete
MADVTLHLVDGKRFDRLSSMSMGEISSGMGEQSLRGSRPLADPRFQRDFDVDLEGDFLELIDSYSDWDLTQPPSAQTQLSSEIGLILAKWCSYARWSCWEARLFLYVEPMLLRKVESAEDFTRPEVWDEFSAKLSETDRASYSESVILDWMSRREALGETMEPSDDPRILPTMESHKSLSESLFSLVDHSRRSGDPILVGREYLDPIEWHLGGKSIADSMVALP